MLPDEAAFFVVEQRVLASCQHAKVFWRIIQRVAIDMVNKLAWRKLSADHSLSDRTVLRESEAALAKGAENPYPLDPMRILLPLFLAIDRAFSVRPAHKMDGPVIKDARMVRGAKAATRPGLFANCALVGNVVVVFLERLLKPGVRLALNSLKRTIHIDALVVKLADTPTENREITTCAGNRLPLFALTEYPLGVHMLSHKDQSGINRKGSSRG